MLDSFHNTVAVTILLEEMLCGIFLVLHSIIASTFRCCYLLSACFMSGITLKCVD